MACSIVMPLRFGIFIFSFINILNRSRASDISSGFKFFCGLWVTHVCALCGCLRVVCVHVCGCCCVGFKTLCKKKRNRRFEKVLVFQWILRQFFFRTTERLGKLVMTAQLKAGNWFGTRRYVIDNPFCLGILLPVVRPVHERA